MRSEAHNRAVIKRWMCAIARHGAIVVCALCLTATAAEHTKDSLDKVKANLKDKKAVLLDVRDKDEWDEGHLADATLVPLVKLRKQESADELLKNVPKDKIVYTHCALGKRALSAADILKERGYDVRPLSAGYEELLKNGFPKAK